MNTQNYTRVELKQRLDHEIEYRARLDGPLTELAIVLSKLGVPAWERMTDDGIINAAINMLRD